MGMKVAFIHMMTMKAADKCPTCIERRER